MGGIFGTISKKSCVADLFYGTDYNSHLGTRRGGLATYSSEKGFVRSIHNLESSYFRTKFEPTLDKFEGATSGIGVISDTDAQPLIMNSHLGRFAICTVAKILNKDELTQHLLDKNMHFAEMSSGSTNPTELVALLIIQGKNFREGIENVFHHIKGSCTMMILTEDGIICARDSWGRTPLIIGKKEGADAENIYTKAWNAKVNARFSLALSNRLNLDFNVSNYWRDTHYSYHDDVTSKTFDMSLGLQYKF